MKFRRLFLLLACSLMLAGCSGNAAPTSQAKHELLANTFDGATAKYANEASNGAFTIHGITITRPEIINVVEFTTDCSQPYLDISGTILYVDLDETVDVTFDERFTSLRTIAITKIQANKVRDMDDLIFLTIDVTTTSIRNLYCVIEAAEKVKNAREAQIVIDFHNNELENVQAFIKSGIIDSVSTSIYNLRMKENGTGTFIGSGNTHFYNCTVCDYGSFNVGTIFSTTPIRIDPHRDISTLLVGGYYDLDPNANAHISNGIRLARGLYTNDFKNFVVSSAYDYMSYCDDWVETGDPKFPWTIDGVKAIIIDDLTIYQPSTITSVILYTNDVTQIVASSTGVNLFLNVNKNMSVCFNERFSSLKTLEAADMYTHGETMTDDIDVNITISTPSLENVNLSYCTPTTGTFNYTLNINVDFSNLNIKQIITEYYEEESIQMITTRLFNFNTCNTGDGNLYYIFKDKTELNNCHIERYAYLMILGSCKINSGYFDIDSYAKKYNRISIPSIHCARGGHYTTPFYHYLDHDQKNYNFPDVGFEWKTYPADPNYNYIITGATVIDGEPIYNPEDIMYVELTSTRHTQVVSSASSLVVNISRSIDLDFNNATFPNLREVWCRYLLSELEGDYTHDVTVNVSVSSESFVELLLNYDLPATANNFTKHVYMNFDFNNIEVPYAVVKVNLGNPNVATTKISNMRSCIGEPGVVHRPGFFDFEATAELYNCVLDKYNTLIFRSNCIVHSGYYDYPADATLETNHLVAANCGRGGFYTTAFKNIVETEGNPRFVKDGLVFRETGNPTYQWTIGLDPRTLSPTPDEIQKGLDDLTTMKNDILNSFIFSIAYSYNYPGQDNNFQIQVAFNFDRIKNYCSDVAESWEKDGFGAKDKLSISFETGNDVIFKYDLLHDNVLTETKGEGETIIDDDPNLPTLPNLHGYRIFTIELGDLLDPSNIANITNSFQVKLSFSIEEPTSYSFTPQVHSFTSFVHNENSSTANSYSFKSILENFLSRPILEENESLLRCKRDLGL